MISTSVFSSPVPPSCSVSHYLSLSQARQWLFFLSLFLPPCTACRLLPDSSIFEAPITSPQFTSGFSHRCIAQFREAGWSTNWNQACQKNYQWPRICRWHHPYGRKQRGTKELLGEGEREEWKSWLKIQHSQNEDHGIQSHHFMANRWGNNRNSDKLYFLGLHNYCR